MKQGTVCFFIRDNKVMLVRIQYPDGVERGNGVGGVVDEGETPEQAVTREIWEEIGVEVKEEDLVRKYEFDSREYHLIVFTTDNWEGEPKLMDSSLKEIKWFEFGGIPFGRMWPGNEEWLPKILQP